MAAIQEETHRIFPCAHCNKQVVICRACDRGQMYCPGECAKKAQRRRQRRAAAQYQKGPNGALNHARRQERYRRRRKKVTHRGSPADGPEAKTLLLSLEVADSALVLAAAAAGKEESLLVAPSLSEPAEIPEAEAGRERPERKEALREEVKVMKVPDFFPVSPIPPSFSGPYRCHFCGRSCGVLSRLDFLREERRKR